MSSFFKKPMDLRNEESKPVEENPGKGFFSAAYLSDIWEKSGKEIHTTLLSPPEDLPNTQKVIVIGRSEDCNIRLHHIGVSLHHALILFEKNGHYIKDNGSTNGTYVNGKCISGQVLLQPSDIIRITNTTFLYNGERLFHCTQNVGVQIMSNWVQKDIVHNGAAKTLVDRVNLKINPGEFVAILGGSGAGKTTFLNCISGYAKLTAGRVFINGEDLLVNYNSYKSIIAYLPQQDTVFHELPLFQMLRYSAEMRMPSDTTSQEIDKRVQEVLNMVSLSHCPDVLIGNLSGGQRKRASIAVELLSDPGVLFLDEPTSGQDPGTERAFMNSMREFSQAGKTVVMVTHTAQNIHLCDKIIFLGEGGKLCFFGTPAQCLSFFQTDDFIGIYNMVAANAQYWQKKYHQSPYSIKNSRENLKSREIPRNKTQTSAIKQWLILQKRYFNLILRDRQRLIILLAQAPIIAILLGLITTPDALLSYEDTKSTMFTLVCACIWIGCSNTIQEVCKERVILMREYMTNLHLTSYILSKATVMLCICFLQSILLLFVFRFFVHWPYVNLFLGSFFNVFLTTFFTLFSSSMLGLLVSSMNQSTDRAMVMLPLLLIPQILFSGILFKLNGFMELFSYFAISRWAMKGYGIAVNLNDLDTLFQINYPDLASAVVRESETIYSFTAQSMVFAWYVPFLMAVICIIASIVALKVTLRTK